MSKLEELIQQLCPEGVEFKKIVELANVAIGEFVRKDKQNPNAIYPVYNGGCCNTGFYEQFNMKAPKVIMSARGAGAGFVNYIDRDFWAGNSCYSIFPKTNSITIKYLYYYLKHNETAFLSNQQKGGIPAVSKKQVEDFSIPLPPLPVQEEIVRLLDQLTETTEKYQAELEAELATHKKQYEEYRNQLLNFEGKEGVEMKTLGEIGEFIRGNGILKTDFVEEGLPCIHYGQIHTKYDLSTNSVISYIDKSLYTKCRKAETGDVILATTSEDVKCVAKPVVWLGSEKVAISGDAYIFRHNQIGKFIAHQFLTHNFLLFKKKYATGAKVVRISGDSMAKYEFPLPSLPEQERIVNILDRMDKTHKELCLSIEDEIKMRKQQYEYYRNQLLDFKKKEE